MLELNIKWFAILVLFIDGQPGASVETRDWLNQPGVLTFGDILCFRFDCLLSVTGRG